MTTLATKFKSEAEPALTQALSLVSRGFINYVAHHADPVRRAGDEELHNFFRRAAEEDLGLEEALIALASERGGGPLGPGAQGLRFGGYNFLNFTRLLDYAVEMELPADLNAARTLQAATAGTDAAASSLLRWIAQTREDQLKRATTLREKLRTGN